MEMDVAFSTLRTRVLVWGRSMSSLQLCGVTGLANPKLEPGGEAQENAPLLSCQWPEQAQEESLSSDTNAHVRHRPRALLFNAPPLSCAPQGVRLNLCVSPHPSPYPRSSSHVVLGTRHFESITSRSQAVLPSRHAVPLPCFGGASSVTASFPWSFAVLPQL